MFLDNLFTASDRIMPRVEQAMSVKECKKVEEGTRMTMDTPLGPDEPVSHFVHIIQDHIQLWVCIHMCVCV
jgi:hypothetical protein